jgi:hypothetical protein
VEMKKFSVVGLALVAMFAFFAVAVASASAETLLWLVNGVSLVGSSLAETEGELNLTRLNTAGAVAGEIKCEGIFDGMIENPAGGGIGVDEITKVLNLSMVDVGEDGAALSGIGIACTVTLKSAAADTTFCTAGTTATVWPANLPWKTTLELMATGEWLDLLTNPTGTPGYEVECTILLGIKATDLCTGNSSSLILVALETLPGTAALGSHGEFNWEAPISSAEATCSTACSATACAGLVGLGVTWAVEGDLNRLETDVSEV